MDDNIFLIVMIVSILIGGLAIGVNRKKKPPRLELNGLDEERAALLQEKYSKAVDDFNFLEQRINNSSDKELADRLKNLQKIGRNILRQMEKNPQRIALAYKFVDYYQDRAVRMVMKYEEIEETQLTTDRVRELKDKIKNTLGGLEAAYEEQLERIVHEQMLTAEAEIRVMEDQLKSEGLHKPKPAIDSDNIEYEQITPVSQRQPIPPRSARPIVTTSKDVIPDDERPNVIKQKMIQSALAIFLGTVGAHKFYQGKTLQGVLYFLFSWTTLPTWIGLLEGVRYLFMPIDDFYLQYIKDD